METVKLMKSRHSVRQYLDKPIPDEITDILQREIGECNRASGLNIKLILNEPKAFSGLVAKHLKFSGVKNYIALIGKKNEDIDESYGYYGERLVLKAQELGLNSCWAMLAKRVKPALGLKDDEKCVILIAIGYGENNGAAHKSKPYEEAIEGDGMVPDWFRRGVKGALLAPTAMNQQKFSFSLIGADRVAVSTKGGFCTKIDLGIAKYHFIKIAGAENFYWA